MEEQNLISSYWRDSDIGGRRHYYSLTSYGKMYEEKYNTPTIIKISFNNCKAKKYPDYPKDQIQIVHTTEVIAMAEPPVIAIKKKKDSSIENNASIRTDVEISSIVDSVSILLILIGLIGLRILLSIKLLSL